jgi:hypothetical protein
MARFGRNISFSKKEYEEVRRIVEQKSNSPLRTLFLKMCKALEPESVPEDTTVSFPVTEAMGIAKSVIGDNLTFAPVMAPLWYVKMNRYIKTNGLTAELVQNAAEVADSTWKKPIYFDTFLYSVMKLVANAEAASKKYRNEWSGFAAKDEVDNTPVDPDFLR